MRLGGRLLAGRSVSLCSVHFLLSRYNYSVGSFILTCQATF
nr:MAG TPA: hypothetical protein [Caudoviricetes sp.]